MGFLHPLDWTLFGGYLVAVLALGLWFAREQHSNEDFFLGGRKMSWMPVGLSMFASIFSSNSFVGLPTQAAFGNYHIYFAIITIPFLVVPVVGWVFVPLFHRLGVTSAYEYLELRFNRPIRLIGSSLFMIYTFAWMGNLLYAVSHVIEPVLGLSTDDLATTAWLLVGIGAFATLYTALGGFKAVIWTDIFQAVALGGGMLAVLWLALGRIEGGWDGMIAVGQAQGKFEMFDLRFDMSPGVDNVYSSLAIGLFAFFPWYAVTLTAVQRYVSMPTPRAAQRSLIVNGVMSGAVCLIFFLVGSTLYAFYHQDVPGAATAAAGFPPLHQNQILPNFVLTEIAQVGLLGLLLSGLFAAAMSSIDSGINALTATVVCDWMSNRQLEVGFSRLLCGVFGAGGILAAVLILYLQSEVYQLIISLSGTFLGLLLGIFLLGMLSKRANGSGVLIGLAAGSLTLALTWTHVGGQWYGAFTCLPTVAVGWLASRYFEAPPASKLKGLVLGQRLQREDPLG